MGSPLAATYGTAHHVHACLRRYAAYGGLYTVLEVLALPAVPLTMTAGLLFGVAPGVAVVSVSSTTAATISFLIARYAGAQAAESIPSWRLSGAQKRVCALPCHRLRGDCVLMRQHQDAPVGRFCQCLAPAFATCQQVGRVSCI